MGDNIEYWADKNETVGLLGRKGEKILVIPEVVFSDQSKLYIDPSNYSIKLNNVDSELAENTAIVYDSENQIYKVVDNTVNKPTVLTASLTQGGSSLSEDINLDIKVRATTMSWSNPEDWIFNNTYTEDDVEQSYDFHPTSDGSAYHIPVIIDSQDSDTVLDLMNAVSSVTFGPEESSEPTEYNAEGTSNVSATLHLEGSNTQSSYTTLADITDFTNPTNVSIKSYVGTDPFYMNTSYMSQHIKNPTHRLEVASNLRFLFDTYIYRFNLISSLDYSGDIGDTFEAPDLIESGSDTITNTHNVGYYSVAVEPTTEGDTRTLPISYDENTGIFTRVEGDLNTCKIVFSAVGPTAIDLRTFEKNHEILVNCYLYKNELHFMIDSMTTTTATLRNTTEGITDWLGFTVYATPSEARGDLSCTYSYVPEDPQEATPIATVNSSTGAVSVSAGVTGVFKLHVVADVLDGGSSTGRTLEADLTITVINQEI